MRSFLAATMALSLYTPALAGDYQRTIPAAGVRQVSVGAAHADVTVIGWKEKKVKIEADADPGVEVEGKNVTVGSFDTEHPPADTPEAIAEWKGRASEIVMHVPAGVDLSVRTLAGEVSVNGLAGRVQLTVISGDVRVEECAGPVEIEAVSGDIDIRGLSADLSAQAVSGEVMVRGFKGLLLETKSVSGSVTVRDAEARTVRVTSHSGDVLYAGTTPADGSVELTTFSGDAVVELPAGSGFEVDATTFSGETSIGPEAEISEKSRQRLRARTSKPGPRLRLKSHSGDVRVK